MSEHEHALASMTTYDEYNSAFDRIQEWCVDCEFSESFLRGERSDHAER